MNASSVECRREGDRSDKNEEADERSEAPFIDQQPGLPIPKHREGDNAERCARDSERTPPSRERRREADGDRTRQDDNARNHMKPDTGSRQLRVADPITEEPGTSIP